MTMDLQQAVRTLEALEMAGGLASPKSPAIALARALIDELTEARRELSRLKNPTLVGDGWDYSRMRDERAALATARAAAFEEAAHSLEGDAHLTTQIAVYCATKLRRWRDGALQPNGTPDTAARHRLNLAVDAVEKLRRKK